jgi:hypothetical protein
MDDDRRSNLAGDAPGNARSEDHAGERDPELSARSLAGRGDALDASEDGPVEGGARDEGDETEREA